MLKCIVYTNYSVCYLINLHIMYMLKPKAMNVILSSSGTVFLLCI